MTDKARVYLVVTFDCRTAGTEPASESPATDAAARQSFRAFCELAQTLSLKPTVFSTAKFARAGASELLEAEQRGCELGVLCQPQAEGYTNYLGGYGYDQQREVIGIARDNWEKATGRKSACFRPGQFSANDFTFSLAVFEGFTHGSCSIPQRIHVQYKSVWVDAVSGAHHTDPLERSGKGTLEFLEVPVTSDFTRSNWMGSEFYTPSYLDINGETPENQFPTLIRQHLGLFEEDPPDLPTLVVYGSNSADFRRKEPGDRLKSILEWAHKLVEGEKGMELVRASIGDVHEAADATYPGATET